MSNFKYTIMEHFISEHWRMVTCGYLWLAFLWSLWSLIKICKILKMQDTKKRSILMKRALLIFVIVFLIIIFALVVTLSWENIYKAWPICVVVVLMLAFLSSSYNKK